MVLAAAALEAWMGRLWLGPDGTFGWLELDIWSPHQSQRILDPYSPSHLLHGLLFYALLWLAARRSSLSARFIGAIALEAAWEVLENSPIVIDRYRAVTIAQGYVGDSILNSVSDIVMAALGFLVAWRLRVLTSVAIVIATELVLLVLIRDNLTLNIVMLLYPIDAIRDWQMAGR
jgi:hypothetical protein